MVSRQNLCYNNRNTYYREFIMKKKLSLLLAGILLLGCLLTLTGCGESQYSVTFYEYFDTVSTVTGFDSKKDFEEAARLVDEVLSDYHRMSDIYYSYSDINNAKTVNEQAGIAPVEVDGRLIEMLEFAKEMYTETNGQCNIMMGAVLSQWHECREEALDGGEARLPEDDALREGAAHCSIDSLVLDREASTVYISDPEASLDLGAVAKGYATEVAARTLQEAGFTGYAMSIGGNARAIGTKPKGISWVAGIQSPESETEYLLRLGISDYALVTSGSYQRYYEVDGVRYHHIVSPDTLYPLNNFVSVSILCPDSGKADILSTALFNMSPEDGMDYVNSLSDTFACWLYPDGKLVMSEGMERFVL